MKSKSYTAIDIAKYISALLVVYIHTFPLLDISETANMFILQAVCRIAVPFFFTVSAFLFFRRIDVQAGWRDAVNLAQLKHFLRRIGLLYLVWTIIYLPYTAIQVHNGASILRWIFDCFFNGSYYHLWFLPALMLSVLIVYMLYLKLGMRKSLILCVLLYLIGAAVNGYGDVLTQIPFIGSAISLYLKVFTTTRNGLFFGPIFIMLGALLQRAPIRSKKEYALGIGISYALLLGEQGIIWASGNMHDLTSMYVMMVPLIYFLVSALLQVRALATPLHHFLRQSSQLIYVSHILFAMPLLSLLGTHHLLVYVIVLIASQLLAALIILLSRRFSWMKVLY